MSESRSQFSNCLSTLPARWVRQWAVTSSASVCKCFTSSSILPLTAFGCCCAMMSVVVVGNKLDSYYLEWGVSFQDRPSVILWCLLIGYKHFLSQGYPLLPNFFQRVQRGFLVESLVNSCD